MSKSLLAGLLLHGRDPIARVHASEFPNGAHPIPVCRRTELSGVHLTT